ncbi:MAG: hypothetical protein AAFV32_06280 [Myxococcota bacterium]
MNGWLVQKGGNVVFAFVDRGGPVLGPLSGSLPLCHHEAVCGKVLLVGGEDVLPVVQTAHDAPALCATLVQAGYTVLPTPPSALEWALGGLIYEAAKLT